jgi:hypothetical protein
MFGGDIRHPLGRPITALFCWDSMFLGHARDEDVCADCCGPRASSTASAVHASACNEPPRCRLLLGHVRIKIIPTRDIDVDPKAGPYYPPHMGNRLAGPGDRDAVCFLECTEAALTGPIPLCCIMYNYPNRIRHETKTIGASWCWSFERWSVLNRACFMWSGQSQKAGTNVGNVPTLLSIYKGLF